MPDVSNKKDLKQKDGRLFTRTETRVILKMINDTLDKACLDGHLIDDYELEIIKSIKNKLKPCNRR